MRTTALLVALATTVAPLASACGSDSGDASSAQKSPYAPTTSPSPSVMTAAPSDFRSVSGQGFTISAPGEFQEQRTTSSNGQPMLILQKPSGISALPQRVVVIRDVDPKQSAAEQSFALESAKAAVGATAKAKRIQVAAPKGQAAFLVSWEEQRPVKGAANTSVTFQQLFWQTGSNLILNVVAFAPSDEFATSEVSRILRSFKAEGS